MMMTRQRKSAVIVTLVMCLFLVGWGIRAPAGEPNVFHEKLSARHQAHRAESRHAGRVVYHYTPPAPDAAAVEADAEEALGNLILEPTVKKAYVYTVISNDQLRALKRAGEPLKIGNIEAQGRIREIVHIVEIQGKLTTCAENLKIGTITLKKGHAHVENFVFIDGSIYSK